MVGLVLASPASINLARFRDLALLEQARRLTREDQALPADALAQIKRQATNARRDALDRGGRA